MNEVTPDELKLALEALSNHQQAAKEFTSEPATVFGSGNQEERTIGVEFVSSADIPVGEVYRTWVVYLTNGCVERVSHYRSRRGVDVDDTLPPDDEDWPPCKSSSVICGRIRTRKCLPSRGDYSNLISVENVQRRQCMRRRSSG